MKNIIAIISTLLVLGLMVFTFTNGRAFQGGEAAKVIQDLKYFNAKISKVKENENIEEDKLNALREKAGNVASFKVSIEYRSKCASCHGVDGSGLQNGKKLMGPKLIGQAKEVLYKDLVDFKAGRKENLIMKGLLMNLDDKDLKNFANEISQFQDRKEALNK